LAQNISRAIFYCSSVVNLFNCCFSTDRQCLDSSFLFLFFP
jgi:hypothetical protein